MIKYLLVLLLAFSVSWCDTIGSSAPSSGYENPFAGAFEGKGNEITGILGYECPGTGEKIVTSISAHLKSAGGGGGNFRCAIYNLTLDTLFAEHSSEVSVLSSWTDGAWRGDDQEVTIYHNLIGGDSYRLVITQDAEDVVMGYGTYIGSPNGDGYASGDNTTGFPASLNFTMYGFVYPLRAVIADASSPCQPTHVGDIWYSCGCSADSVQAAIDSSSNGDTVVMGAGTATWLSREGSGDAKSPLFINNKSITLRGRGTDSTIIRNGLTLTDYDNNLIRIRCDSNPVRLCHFTIIDSNNARDGGIYFYKSTNVNSNTNGNRIDHMNFLALGDVQYSCVPILIIGLINGVCDHDSSFSTGEGGIAAFIEGYKSQDDSPALGGSKTWDLPSATGTSNMWYIENCYFDYTGSSSGVCSVSDGSMGWEYCARYNTLVNARSAIHAAGPSGGRGGRWSEIYNNIINYSAYSYAALHIRGGSGVVFNNELNNNVGSLLILDNQRTDSATAATFSGDLGCWCHGECSIDGNDSLQGYPCLDQVGFDSGGVGAQKPSPVYVWGNTKESSSNNIVIMNPSFDSTLQKEHIKKDRDYFEGVIKPNYYAYTYPHPLTGEAASMSCTSISPASGAAGIADTINGSGFQAIQGNGYVKYGSTLATIVSWSDTKIAVTVPAVTGAKKVFVVNNDFQVDSSKTYTVDSTMSGNYDSLVVSTYKTQIGNINCNYMKVSGTDSVKFNDTIIVRDSVVYNAGSLPIGLPGSILFSTPGYTLVVKLNGISTTPRVINRSKIRWR